MTIRHHAAGRGVLSASLGFRFGSRIGRWPCLSLERSAGGAQADVAPLLSIARWIALREQGDHTSVALSGGGAIP